MLPFDYVNPVEVVFGAGSRSCLKEKAGQKYKKILFVCAKGPFEELRKEIQGYMEEGGCQVFNMGGIDSNPRLSSVKEGVAICQANGIEAVVALGGGSAMDAAKMIAASAKTGIDPYEYIWGSRPKVEDSLDTILIPSFAATGTELNPSAVIVNDETKEKYYTDCKHAKIAVLDAEIYAGAPYRLAVWGAMDILSHTFEYYFNGCTASEFQSRFSEALIHSVMHALRQLKADPQDLQARGELMWCADMAWGGLTKIGRGDPEMSCHWIEESFSGYFDTHHGACLGVLTPRWMDEVYKTASAPFARFARNIFGVTCEDDEQAAHEGIEKYKDFLVEIGAPLCFGDISTKEFKDSELEHVAKTALRIYHGHIGKLKPLSEDDIIRLLKSGRERLR